MVMPKSPVLENRKVYASQDDILEAVQAIRDHIDGLIQERLDSTEAEVGFRLNKVLDNKLTKVLDGDVVTKLKDLRHHCDHSISQLEGKYGGWASELGSRHDKALEIVRAEYAQKTLALEEFYEKSLGQVQANYEQKILALEGRYEKQLSDLETRYEERSLGYEKKLASLEESHQEKLGLLKSCVDTGVEQVKTLLGQLSLPTPSVVFSPEIKASDVVVKLPEQAPPVVNVAPEVKMADNIVNVPPPRLTKKVFEYHPDGRPASVEEFEK